MLCGQINFPDKLIQAIREGKLVVFAGAGVSMGEPARLPSFWTLAERLAEGTNHKPTEQEPLDRFLGELQHQGTKIHERAAAFLTREGLEATPLQTDLLRLFNGSKAARIVTTNFDLLFEQGAQKLWGAMPDVFRAPALPLGGQFTGIVHLHGSVVSPLEMVLTDGDFGRAYLTEGWARRFLVELFSKYTVLFVGYRHEDVVMNYLARALPPGTGNRFVLDAEGADAAAWNRRGIELITFPKPGGSHDYSCLEEGIRKLANSERRGALEWQRDIGEIAAHGPPPDQPSAQETIDLLKNALTDEAKTRFFVEKARDPGWLEWLDQHKLLEPLFRYVALDKTSQILARWVADQYVRQHPTECLALFGKHHLNLNPQFWYDIVRSVGLSKEPIAAEVFAKWVSVLLDAAPRGFNVHLLHWLAEKAQSFGCHRSSLDIFTSQLVGRLTIRPGFSFSGEGKPEPRVEINISDDRQGWEIGQIWIKAIQPNLGELAPDIVSRLAPVLEQRHWANAVWKLGNDRWDSDSYGRSAIEPHEQDKYPEALDIVIDAIRDSLEALASTQPEQLFAWTQLLLASRAPLLRRLGVHALRINGQIAASDKIDLLIAKGLLLETNLHHEVFILLQQNYASASDATRKALIQAISSYKWPIERENQERLEAGEKYKWLHWLAQADPQCTSVREALEAIASRFPELKSLSLEHSEFTHWTGESSWRGPSSPWSPEELLQRVPAEWLPALLAFKEDRFHGPDRYGFQQSIAEASKQSVQWGLDLAEAIAAGEHWESDIWKGLLRAWQEWPEDLEAAKKIVQWLGHPKLLAAQGSSIADVLLGLCKDEPKAYAKDLLPQTNEIARKIWPLLDRSERDLIEHNWLSASINHPAGVIAQYWLKSLSLSVQPGAGPNQVPMQALEDLDTLLKDNSQAGGYARTFFASQFTYLHYLNEEWAKSRLLPLFTSNDAGLLKQAWDGFLSWGRLTSKIVELLKPGLFMAVERLTDAVTKERRRFIEMYVASMSWCDDEVVNDWVPRFFANASEEDRDTFASQIHHVLRGLNDKGQREVWDAWLCKYWQNRIDGIPALLSDAEANRMLDWVVELPDVFPEAVQLALRMPKPRLEHSMIVFRLRKEESPIAEKYPNEVAQLLCYLLDCPDYGSALYNVGELIAALDANRIDPTVKAALIGKLVEQGIDASPLF